MEAKNEKQLSDARRRDGQSTVRQKEAVQNTGAPKKLIFRIVDSPMGIGKSSSLLTQVRYNVAYREDSFVESLKRTGFFNFLEHERFIIFVSTVKERDERFLRELKAKRPEQPPYNQSILELIRRAVYDMERGMGAYDAVIDDDAARFLADLSGGDARRALNAVELGVMTTPRSEDGKIHLTMDVARECIQKRTARYDKKGDNHYDTISAFIKSMRGSDPDAAVYYLARMIEAGEDPVFIARRIMICAAEDVGNADPNAIVVAVNCSLACERIGMPESQIILAQAAEYVATAPKSNTAVESIMAARRIVQETGSLPIPGYLQDAHYKGAAGLGRGLGYQYAHEYEDHYAGQPLLPEKLRGTAFYQPSDNGYEKTIRKHMSSLTGDEKYTRPEQLLPREHGKKTNEE